MVNEMCSQSPATECICLEGKAHSYTEYIGIALSDVFVKPNPAVVGGSATLTCIVENSSEKNRVAVVRVRTSDANISVTPKEQT